MLCSSFRTVNWIEGPGTVVIEKKGQLVALLLFLLASVVHVFILLTRSLLIILVSIFSMGCSGLLALVSASGSHLGPLSTLILIKLVLENRLKLSLGNGQSGAGALRLVAGQSRELLRVLLLIEKPLLVRITSLGIIDVTYADVVMAQSIGDQQLGLSWGELLQEAVAAVTGFRHGCVTLSCV
jgi:hypothetical protein